MTADRPSPGQDRMQLAEGGEDRPPPGATLATSADDADDRRPGSARAATAAQPPLACYGKTWYWSVSVYLSPWARGRRAPMLLMPYPAVSSEPPPADRPGRDGIFYPLPSSPMPPSLSLE
jgi:hypothetical protein